MFTIETYVATWMASDGGWHESQAQQRHWSQLVGIGDECSREAAAEFARVLTTDGNYAGRVRIIHRTDEIIENL